jgi:hypothetical protein
VPGHMLRHLIVKELSDNALDAADRADRPGAVKISVDADGNLIVADHGTGIDKTPQELATDVYCVARPMVSSKLLRKASRGAIGNGLRCCVGWITATQAMLQVRTGRYRVTLKPERDGTTSIVDAEEIDPVPGTRLKVIAGEQRFEDKHLAWARDAIELARRSGEPAFKRKPSAHWFDVDTFHDLLMTADGNPNVRDFLNRFDGCSGSEVRSEIAANFQRRGVNTIKTRGEAAELLTKAQELTTALPAKALRPLGRDAIVCDGYAMMAGTFTDGSHEPKATIPFIVEAWVNAYDPQEDKPYFSGRFYMNRTKALTRYDGILRSDWLDLTVGNVRMVVDIPDGPHYAVDIAITSPYFIALNDGKEPDCRLFADEIEQAVVKAANSEAARDIAAQLTAHEKQVANIQPLLQAYFDALVTDLEAERGEALHPNLIREARGNLYLPHIEDPVPLGTLNVRSFTRLPWTFASVMVIEKDDLALMAKKSGFCEHYDCAVLSCKGFTTRAGRDLIDKIVDTGEPVRVFSVHDADAAGTLIHHTLQNATRARGARKIQIIDFGLQPWEGVALGLQVEEVEIEYTKDGKQRKRPVGEYVQHHTEPAPTGETWDQWLQHSRVELNAMKPLEMRAWLDGKMAEHDVSKLIPPDDILTDQFMERVREPVEDAVETAIARRRDDLIAAIEAEQDEATKEIQAEIDRITADLRAQKARVSAPFVERIETARSEALAIDRETVVRWVIRQMTPDVELLRTAINGTFAHEPELRWSTALNQIADDTEVGDVVMDDHLVQQADSFVANTGRMQRAKLRDVEEAPDEEGEGRE